MDKEDAMSQSSNEIDFHPIVEAVLEHVNDWDRPPTESLMAATEWGGSIVIGDRRFSMLHEGAAVLETSVADGAEIVWKDGHRL
jgi:hypothetical protein